MFPDCYGAFLNRCGTSRNVCGMLFFRRNSQELTEKALIDEVLA
jgi:hypothetical protein